MRALDVRSWGPEFEWYARHDQYMKMVFLMISLTYRSKLDFGIEMITTFLQLELGLFVLIPGNVGSHGGHGGGGGEGWRRTFMPARRPILGHSPLTKYRSSFKTQPKNPTPLDPSCSPSLDQRLWLVLPLALCGVPPLHFTHLLALASTTTTSA